MQKRNHEIQVCGLWYELHGYGFRRLRRSPRPNRVNAELQTGVMPKCARLSRSAARNGCILTLSLQAGSNLRIIGKFRWFLKNQGQCQDAPARNLSRQEILRAGMNLLLSPVSARRRCCGRVFGSARWRGCHGAKRPAGTGRSQGLGRTVKPWKTLEPWVPTHPAGR